MFVLFFCVAALYSNNKSTGNSVLTSSTASLSNKKIGWGIKKTNNHTQPDLGSKNKELINKYNGIAMGNPDKKYIYITFDEGYEAGYTAKILDVLKGNNVKAAFFITGYYLNSSGDLVKRMIDEGHIVGNHTVNHYSMPDIDNAKLKDEVMKLHTALYEKFGYEMKYLRPPMGEYSERVLNETNNLGYIAAMWSFGYVDWDPNKQKGEDYAKKTILDNLHNGEVMLLHATSSDNANVLDSVIKEAKAQGYEFKSLDEFEK